MFTYHLSSFVYIYISRFLIENLSQNTSNIMYHPYSPSVRKIRNNMYCPDTDFCSQQLRLIYAAQNCRLAIIKDSQGLVLTLRCSKPGRDWEWTSRVSHLLERLQHWKLRWEFIDGLFQETHIYVSCETAVHWPSIRVLIST